MFSLMSLHRDRGRWEIPASQGSLEEVNMFETGFDSDHCLEMRPLIKHPIQTANVFAQAYRRLWLDVLTHEKVHPEMLEIDQLSDRLAGFYDLSSFKEVNLDLKTLMSFACELKKMAHQGLKQVGDIARLYKQGGDPRICRVWPMGSTVWMRKSTRLG